MPRPFGPLADDPAQRAQWTDEFIRRAFARPDSVGWHYHRLIDAAGLEGFKPVQGTVSAIV